MESNSITLNLQDPTIYLNCIKNVILYWYKDFITLYDGVNEVIVRKNNVISIQNTYNSYGPVYNRYVRSKVIIRCSDGLIINCLINSSPQSAPGSSYISKVTYSGGYNLGPFTYTNGASTTINSYIDNDGNVNVIDGNDLYKYIGVQSLYTALNVAMIKFNPATRNDQAYDILISGKYVGNPTGAAIAELNLPSSCILAFDVTDRVVLSDSNIVTWQDRLKNVILNESGSIVLDSDNVTPNGISSINMSVSGLLKNDTLNFTTLGVPIGNAKRSIAIVASFMSIPQNTFVCPVRFGGVDGMTGLYYFNLRTPQFGYFNGSTGGGAGVNEPIEFDKWSVISMTIDDIKEDPSASSITIHQNNRLLSYSALLKTNTISGTGTIEITGGSYFNIAGLYIFNDVLTSDDVSRMVTYANMRYGISTT